MLRTRFTELFGIEHPIVQASLGPWTSVELSAAVSNAGGIGSLGTAMTWPHELAAMFEHMRELTDRPFIVNHIDRPLNEEAFAASLEARPTAVSFALGLRPDLVERAHEAGVLFLQQVHTVYQAREAAEAGVDAIIAQGTEAAGFGGTVATMPLLPQVVDAVAPVPVLAAGGIADGRGLAAALVLGAAGANVGTRFLAAEETAISPLWKHAIVEAASQQAVKVEFADHVFPPPGDGGYSTRPRVLETPFVAEWNARLEDVPAEAERLRESLTAAIRDRSAHELVPFTGQSAGLIEEILPAGEIVRRMVAQAEELLRAAPGLVD